MARSDAPWFRPPRRARVANRRSTGGFWWRVPVLLVLWAILAAPFAAAGGAVAIYAGFARDLPAVPDLDAFERRAPRTNLILAADGTVLAAIPFVVGASAGHRTWAHYAELPRTLVLAILAAEDVRFFEHGGVDARAVARAALANSRAGRTVEGASTITQQVARNLLPEAIGRERSFRRKAREAILARRIERRWSKQRILETWANQVFLGAGAYGVAAAARAYFDKPLDELTVAECALIAGLAQAPGRADPLGAPTAALARRDEVLDRMERAGFLAAGEHAAARATPLDLRPPVPVYGKIAPWITERARREIAEVAPEDWARGGVVVETTALPAFTLAAEEAARTGAERIGRRHAAPAPEVAVVVYDHGTGYVEALVGGLDFTRSRFDRASQACRQPGSAFKPFVYAAALERDLITPGTPLRDAPVAEYDEARDLFWKPKSGRSFRGVALAQDAIAASLNAPAIDVLDRVGTAAPIELAARLGLTTEIAAVRPLVLGASCVIPFELARAFGVFAQRGRLPEPTVVVRTLVRGRPALDRGSPWDPFAAPARRLDRLVAELAAPKPPAVDEPTAFLMASMLAEAARSGTARAARALGRPVAGKTGTTNDNIDAWFVGFTGRVAGAVWVGHDDPARALGSAEDGAHAALPVWLAVVRALEQDRPAVAVPGPPPPGVVSARVDRETGLLASPGAGGAQDLYFRAGTAPTEAVDATAGVRDLARTATEF